MTRLVVGARQIGIGVAVLAFTFLARSAVAGQFSDWSAPQSLGTDVNSSVTDGCPAVAKNDLTLFFASNRPGGYGLLDIYVSQRESTSDPWEPPLNAGPVVNGSGNDICPTLVNNGHLLLFVSDRAGGCGLQDLYVAWRRDKRDDFGWEAVENLGCVVNSAANDFSPSIFEDERTGETILYFSSNRSGGPGGVDIYETRPDQTGAFGVASVVWELSTTADDQRPNVRKDGREVFFDSNRSGSAGGDLWTATRASVADVWSVPVNLGATVNSASTEGRPALSFDGRTLYFMSARPGGSGGLDLYFSTRTKGGSAE